MAENTDLKAFAEATKSLKDATKNIGEKDGVFGTALKNNFSAGFKALSGPFAAVLGPAKILAKITMLSAVKKSIADKWKNYKDKELFKKQFDLSNKEFKDLVQKKKIADANKKWADSLGSAAENLLGADASRVTELVEQNATLKEIREAVMGGNKEQQEQHQETEDSDKKQTIGGALQAEKNKETIRHRDKMGRFAERTADGVEELNKTFLQSLKEKAKLALGTIVAIGIAILVAFFKEIAKQIRWMKTFTGAKFGKLFAPIKLFFSEKGPFGKAIKSIKDVFTSIKKSKFIVGLKKAFTTGWTKLIKFFKPISDFFKEAIKLASKGTGVGKILKWAKTFGKVLGKIFLPITILMSAWDLITGAISGWEKEGEETDSNMVTKFIAAIGGGLGKFAENLIGIPLKWLTKGIAWIAGMLGFDEASTEISEFANKIPKFLNDLYQAPFRLLKAAVKWITNLFTSDDPAAELGKLWTKLVGAGNWIVNAIGKGLNSIWEWFKGLFDIDFAEIAKAIVPDWAPDFIKKAVGIPVKGKSVGELQKEVKAMETVVGMGDSTSGQREKLDDLRKELETLKRQNQGAAAGGSVNVKADTNIHNERTAISTAVLTKPNPMIAEIAGSPF